MSLLLLEAEVAKNKIWSEKLTDYQLKYNAQESYTQLGYCSSFYIRLATYDSLLIQWDVSTVVYCLFRPVTLSLPIKILGSVYDNLCDQN